MTPQQKLRAATTARTLKNKSRPRFEVNGRTHRGLLPDEIEAFYAAVRAAQDRRLQDIRAAMPRKRCA